MKKAIIITGSNSGIGLECTKQFCENTSDTIIAISRNTNYLQTLSYTNLLAIACNVVNYESLQKIMD